MITDNMKLESRLDADLWADNFGLSTDEQIARLADWIWANKPFIGCTIDDHPLSILSDEEFWNITEPEQ